MLMISYNILKKRYLDGILKFTDIIRFNSAWFTKSNLIDSLASVSKPRFVDVHRNRTKDKVQDHDYYDLLKICNDMHVDWVGISKVEGVGEIIEVQNILKNNFTKVCAKIESRTGVEKIGQIIKYCDGIMVDKEDLATDINSGMESLELSKKVYSICRANNIPTFEMYGVIFNYEENIKKKTVYTYGVFDLLHTGHIRLLQNARNLGEELIVGVVRDEPVKKLKGEDRPIQSFDERLSIISELKCVDLAVEQKEYDPTPNLILFNPDVLTKGDDWEHIPGQEWAAENKKEFVKLPYSKDVSTSKTVDKIKNATRIW